MNIFWHGLTCFKLVDGEFTLLIDPYDKSSGLRQPRYSANLVLLTNPDPAADKSNKVVGNPYVVTGPGEYESGGTFVYGVATPVNEKQVRPSTMYMFERGGISFAHLGELAQTLAEEHLDRLEGVDVLMIPVGSHGSLSADQASKLITEIEPRIIIPMLYKIPGLKKTYDSLINFTKIMGVKSPEGIDKLKLAKKDLPQDEARVVIINKQ
ncbi:MBL fold metallo-hydrolase [Patescibacteria group bacterium]